ncbi:MAG: aldo/keto reductase [Thiomonas sp.]
MTPSHAANPPSMRRRIGPFEVASIGLGCMNLSHAYGVPPTAAEGEALLRKALDLGVDLFDTAALYGFGANEELLGRALAPDRARFTLASKGGMAGVDGKRVIDGRPEALRRNCEDSLRRLRTDVIDLYYLHRWDKRVPIEESVGAMAELVRAGKVRAVGLSEVSAATLRRAHAVHPIAAVQSEYSLWTRNPEIALLDACRDLGVSLVAFSPLGRGFLAGGLRDVTALDAKDIRRAMPRFTPENYAANLRLLDALTPVAAEAGYTPAQLALSWVLSRGDHVVAIPGTTSEAHLRENWSALTLQMEPALRTRVEAMIHAGAVSGARYNAATQAEIDSEEFPPQP